ncbi:aminopeptidase [Pseudooceanicola sediminis]|uniref:Aminopeptidase n=1 Tax=Pseudooceanicola sediminis TaxID=2211117 RepID=A0A399J822_9RHOB|nr:aminopeptidase [Pseudooceanicola sediminis]KAA2315660.1 aminopeptidase [Puniceibacterium sp. HSS470]RII40142.1 aminopeptidase [Pseudooceanicola sediminis]|tara:strand:+ start:69519 stop:70760 length:1242 start_codon:yes stop_codon:yes gene_type:complete
MSKTPIDPATLDRLAEVAVKVGLDLQPGQDLILTAPTTALPLVRRIAAAAYRAGAGVVTPILSDAEVTLARYRHGHDETFDTAPSWLYNGMAEAYGKNAARMAIVGDDPMLLAEMDAAKVARAGKANSIAYKPALSKISNFDINWTIVAYPGTEWAQRMFPDLSADDATAKLADAIFAASRVTGTDAVAEWQQHNAALRARTRWLNDQRFDALRYTGPGTDLTIGLADDHEWHGGASEARNGVTCNPNMPTEEVFTTPHAHRVNGTVRATKPLAHQGNLIENIEMTFKDGRAVSATASGGEENLIKLIDTDEGARRLGEVALVPHSSPISASGLLFYNTLFDENASCHIALGQCYSKCFLDGATLSEAEIAEKGGNSSMIHVDWMIGSDEIDIDGIKPDGTLVPVFRKGEWAQ